MRHQPIYIDTPEGADAYLDSIAKNEVIALDTEGASFHRFIDRIYLLQLSTRDSTAVIDPLPLATPAGLGRLLESERTEVVFHDADYDLRLLRQDYGWQVRNIFDTRVAAQLLGIKSFGLAALLERSFGVKLDKKHQRADWSMRPLTAGMLEYAAQDTMYLLDLRDQLAGELRAKGRWSWAEEEFTRLEETRWDGDDDANAFLRIKGARDLNRRELAVFRELVHWRNEVARRADRATFRVIGNEPLMDIARTRPTTREGLAAVKGMPRGLLERAWSDIAAAVERGIAVPEGELPRFPRAPRWDRDPDFDARVSALKTARDAAATRLELDSGVLCARDRLETVARKNPRTLDELTAIGELRRWQVSELGPAFVAALAPHQPRTPVRSAAPVESPYADG